MIAGANGITKAHAWSSKYIRDYLVLSRESRTDQLISTFAKVPLTLGSRPFHYRKGGKRRIRGR